MGWVEKWEKIQANLQKLDWEDEQEESELLKDAYENLIRAYQEARSLNEEMEEPLKENYSIEAV